MAPIRYYHVVNRDGRWHLYFGNSFSPLLTNDDRRKVIDAARKLARQNGMKIVIHKAPEAPSPDNDPNATAAPDVSSSGGAAPADH